MKHPTGSKQDYINYQQKEEIALERFKDWYLSNMEQDEWQLPLPKAIQLLASDDDMTDFTKDIAHYYYVHQVDTWADLKEEIQTYNGNNTHEYNNLLREYIIELTL